jgi:hypothetical protein
MDQIKSLVNKLVNAASYYGAVCICEYSTESEVNQAYLDLHLARENLLEACTKLSQPDK